MNVCWTSSVMNCVITCTEIGSTLVREFHGSCVKLSFVKVCYLLLDLAYDECGYNEHRL